MKHRVKLDLLVVLLKVDGTRTTMLLDSKLIRKTILIIKMYFKLKKKEFNCNIKWSILYDIMEIKSLHNISKILVMKKRRYPKLIRGAT